MAVCSVRQKDDESLYKGITVCRLMGPCDANVYGNIHGGIILNLLEEAGTIICTRYCNVKNRRHDTGQSDCVAALVRIEHLDFHQPMYIGEVAELTAEITYTSTHSMEVVVTVWAENCIKGIRRLTNRARMWYVPLSLSGDEHSVQAVPNMTYSDPEAEETGRLEYEKQKADRAQNDLNMAPIPLVLAPYTHIAQYTVPFSQTCLTLVVGVNDVAQTGHCKGGVILKVMDECAGIVSVKHCQNVAVTACITATNFHKLIPKGSVVTVFGQATFTSARSIEVEVIVEFEMANHKHDDEGRTRAMDSFFTYVCLDKELRTLPIPPLKIKAPDEKMRFAAGKKRYEMRKQKRARKASVSFSTIYTRQFTAESCAVPPD